MRPMALRMPIHYTLILPFCGNTPDHGLDWAQGVFKTNLVRI